MDDLTVEDVVREYAEGVPQALHDLCMSLEGGQDLYNYMATYGFFLAPATLKYHGCFEGGLALHTWNVYNYLLRLNEIWGNKYSEQTLAKVALCHQLAKTDFYEEYFRNVKVDGQWVQQPAYRVKENRYMAGDLGFTSYMIASRYLAFTDEEIIAICNYLYLNEMERHAGLPDLLHKYPLISLLYTAYTFATYNTDE